MTTRTMSRRKSKAVTLVPLALISAASGPPAWSPAVDTATAPASHARQDLPDGTAVPQRGDRGPGQRARSPARSPRASRTAPPTPWSPAPPPAASRRAGPVRVPARRPDHRRRRHDLQRPVGADRGHRPGRVRPRPVRRQHPRQRRRQHARHLRHPQLNGKNGTQAIIDTDGGQLDKDTVYDRAVGPMQFIPSTWRSSRSTPTATASATRRTSTTPSLATGVYLCSGTDDLSTRERPGGGGLPLQPQPRRTSTWCCGSWRPTARATTPRSRRAPTAARSPHLPELLLRDRPLLQAGRGPQGQAAPGRQAASAAGRRRPRTAPSGSDRPAIPGTSGGTDRQRLRAGHQQRPRPAAPWAVRVGGVVKPA